MSSPSPQRPVAIEVRDLSKSFVIPGKQAPRRMFGHSRGQPHTLKVLDSLSFDVFRGEFFGIVGRNGSGKSTLLKLLASVYSRDSGTIRVAGRIAPLLELGVGFNPQLAAHDNILLNAVMMGLSRKEARRRADEMIDFAGLAEFAGLPLKNYSSGMKVRLAFAVLTQVDADVLLLDEVMAVGDAEFQGKSEAVLRGLRDSGTTIVLVTHSMSMVNAYCDRALLIHDGRIAKIGAPIEISNLYLEVNMRAAADRDDPAASYAGRFAEVIADPPARIVDGSLHDAGSGPAGQLDAGVPLNFVFLADILRPIERPGFRFRVDDLHGRTLFAGGETDLGLPGGRAEPGERLRIKTCTENRLAPGRYVFSGAISQETESGAAEPATPITTINFEITGDEALGFFVVPDTVTVERLHTADL
jgi:ABC-2 type transport system ATP-binding protein